MDAVFKDKPSSYALCTNEMDSEDDDNFQSNSEEEQDDESFFHGQSKNHYKSN